MSDDSLIEAMPDFVAFLRRDGVVLRHLGGRRLSGRLRDEPVAGRKPEEIWDDAVAQQLKLTIRRALANRSAETLGFSQDGRGFEARISAHGRERVICVIREAAPARADSEREGVRSGAIERREFYDRLQDAIADAALRERRLALCVIHVDGLDDIGGIIDFSVGQQVTNALLLRLAAPQWDVRRIGDGVFGAVVRDFDERGTLRGMAEDMQRRLLEPVDVGDASFSVRPAIGIAVLGDDGNQAGTLLDHAQTAVLEARRTEAGGIHFYSDTLKLRSLARLDFQRELRDAIAADAFALRYAARCELAGCTLSAVNAYLRWPSSLRQDIKPSEFLPVAESTGLALDLSRWALQRLRRDAPVLRGLGGGKARLSFGALRQHFASDALLNDVSQWLASGEILASQLELRLSERTLSGLSSPGRVLRPFQDLGVHLVVDEFGRGYSSLPRLARMPLHALQIDRGLVTSARNDDVSARAARTALAMAQSLGLVSIASGIDDEADLAHWRGLGCAEGLGDHFGNAQPSTHAAGTASGKRAQQRR